MNEWLGFDWRLLIMSFGMERDKGRMTYFEGWLMAPRVTFTEPGLFVKHLLPTILARSFCV